MSEQEQPNKRDGISSSDDLIKALQDYLEQKEGTEEGENEEEITYIQDNRELYEQEIKPLLEKVMSLCTENQMPLIMMLVSEISEEGGMGTHNWVHMPFSICEMKAIVAILSLDHDFSHMVLQNAAIYQTMFGSREDNRDG